MRSLVLISLLTTIALAQPESPGFRITLPDTTVTSGDTLSLPIRVNDLTGHNIISFEFSLSYPGTSLNYLGLETENTLSAGGTVMDNPNTEVDRMKVAGMFTAPLQGPGELLYLRFTTLQPDTVSLAPSGVLLNTFHVSEVDSGTISVIP